MRIARAWPFFFSVGTILLLRINYCLFGFGCRLLEDFVSIKVRRLQGGRATAFDFALLGWVHARVLARIDALRASPTAPGAGASAAVGLENDKVAIAPYDSNWPAMFEAESARLREQFGAELVGLHHIGSTAIPGLPAKPIIDLALALPPDLLDRRRPELILRMRLQGYRYLGDWKRRGGFFFEKVTGQGRTHAIQVHPADSADLRRLLRFRDLMRSDPRLLTEYAQVKAALAQILANQRGFYFWYKSHWLNDLLLEQQGSQAWGTWWLSTSYPTMLQIAGRSLVRMASGGRCGAHPMAN